MIKYMPDELSLYIYSFLFPIGDKKNIKYKYSIIWCKKCGELLSGGDWMLHMNTTTTYQDDRMINFMLYAYINLKLLLEPACVAGFAALKKLNTSKFKGQNTLLILCGSNIDYKSWNKLVKN